MRRNVLVLAIRRSKAFHLQMTIITLIFHFIRTFQLRATGYKKRSIPLLYSIRYNYKWFQVSE